MKFKLDFPPEPEDIACHIFMLSLQDAELSDLEWCEQNIKVTTKHRHRFTGQLTQDNFSSETRHTQDT